MVSTAGRARGTREAILDAAERLFAEHGVGEVSNRRISEAAGQGNHFAVGYHFGTKADLVRAIVHRYTAALEERRLRLLEEIGGSGDLRDWVSCLVRPATEHLDALGPASRRAQCMAQITTVPALRQIVIDESAGTPSMRATLDGMLRLLPGLPEQVRQERAGLCRLLLVHALAERERALNEGDPAARTTWDATATGLVDALTGLWLAPSTASPGGGSPQG
ncbi:helix-turn-helix domain-containing protein [Nonomuraea rubra]|uniref:AcrR family transcriptional regulator n=1 Tax=Nonomuraea rubra TaxID=46180 RepID=A0A7X0U0I9_9ACTN|nr:helix-turn-helix domain-containing protein [Nonomuraea rubra]MBB6550603.1 AcrR family transcriptional regulator [Nonomuraea rubra]